MLIPVRSLLGTADIPSHRASAVSWLCRQHVTILQIKGNGGLRDAVALSELPEPALLHYPSDLRIHVFESVV